MSAQPLPGQPRVRPMVRSDLGTVSRIEKRAYEFSWNRGLFKDCLNAGYCCQVLEQAGEVVGYGILSVALDEAHLLNLCIAPDWQGRGLATRLLWHIIELARVYGARTLFLEVRPSNERALRLYTRAGFCEVGNRRDYYPAARGRREDALIMARQLEPLPRPAHDKIPAAD